MTIIFHETEPWHLPHMDNCPNDTVRRFPRSTREAFADERYPAIERTVTDRGHSAVLWVCAMGVVVLVCLIKAGVV